VRDQLRFGLMNFGFSNFTLQSFCTGSGYWVLSTAMRVTFFEAISSKISIAAIGQ